MLCHRLTSPIIQPLSPDGRAGDALLRMEEFGLSHLPVVEDGRFQGLVSETALMDADQDAPLSLLHIRFIPALVGPQDLFTVAVRRMVTMQTDLVAVVDARGMYEGSLTRESLFREVAEYSGMTEEGSVLVMEMERSFYSAGELCRIVESNDAILTQLHTHEEPSSSLLTVLLMVNRQDVSDLAAAFKRFGYTVLYQQGQDAERDELISNLENLMNYLNV